MATKHSRQRTHLFNMAILLYIALFLSLSTCDVNIGDQMNTNRLINYAAWNMRSLTAGLPYLKLMMQTVDIVAVSEHGLYDCQLWKLTQVNSDFNVTAKACSALNDERLNYCVGHSGVALFWRDTLSQYVKPVTIKSDRICAIEVMLPDTRHVIVASVYLPHRASTIANYTEELALLEELVEGALSNELGIVILGDINAHFGPELGSRGWGHTSPNGVEFARFVARNNLHIADMGPLAYGPTYTFQSQTRHAGESYIDHCIVSDNVKDGIDTVCVYEDCIINCSDHLPLGLCMLQVKYEPVQVEVTNVSERECRIVWDKMSGTDIREKYTFPLDVSIEQVLQSFQIRTGANESTYSLSNTESLEQFTKEIKEAMSNTAATLVPRQGKRTHLKPYWTSQLTGLSREQKTSWRRWVDAGRPRHEGSPEWEMYKNAKREFRRLQRETVNKYHFEQIEQLCKQSEIDQKGFWYIVNKVRKPRQPRVTPIKGQNGEMLTDPGAIAEDWRQYYEELFNSVGAGQGYNDQFYDHVMHSVKDMETESHNRPNDITEPIITVDEVQTIYKTLKTRKAPGFDGITNEHLKYSGPVAIRAVTIMLNSMVQLEYIPHCFKQGIICPIPKGGGKDSSKKQNNRPITLLPCMYKVFEKILLNRLDVWLQSNHILCEMQGAGLPRCSSTDVGALLQETVAHHTELGNTVYVVLMDVAKAFDSVWSEGLLYKLFNYGIEGRFWRILKTCYDGFKCKVLVNKRMSGELKVKRGVHQGAPLSMRLYQLYNNDLLKQFIQSGICIGIVDLRTGALAFADDVALLALYKLCMNVLLSMARRHSILWRYDYNPGKFQGLCFGKDKAVSQPIKMGDQEIVLKAGTNHMGVPLFSTSTEMKEQIIQRCERVKREVRVMMSMGSARLPLPSAIGSKIYKTALLPKLMYGLEACTVNRTCLDELEKTHRYCAKLIQDMPSHVSNPVPLATLGWQSVQSMLNFNKMVFLYRWLSLPTSCIYKKVAILRLVLYIYGNVKITHEGPLIEAYFVFVKYGLQQYILDVLETGNKLHLKQFKRLLRRVVTQRDHAGWDATVLLYRGLTLFRECFPRIELCVWWRVSHYRPHLVTVVHLVCGIVGDPARRRENPSGHCALCENWEADDAPHLLFTCSHLSSLRDPLWRKVLSSMPDAMSHHVLSLNVAQRTMFILSGFYVNFTLEWLDIYGTVALFVASLYNKKINVTGII